jgi:hypothetical protein
MSISAMSIRLDDASMWIELSDGRTIGVPFPWFPRLPYATIPKPSSTTDYVEVGEQAA